MRKLLNATLSNDFNIRLVRIKLPIEKESYLRSILKYIARCPNESVGKLAQIRQYDTQARLISQECWERSGAPPARLLPSTPPSATLPLPLPLCQIQTSPPRSSAFLFTIQRGRYGLLPIYFATIKISKEKEVNFCTRIAQLVDRPFTNVLHNHSFISTHVPHTFDPFTLP